MKKVGKEVLFLNTCENNPRNGEGSFARLGDGRILFAFTEYVGKSREDHAIARISACYSSDEGETWTDKEVLLEKEKTCLNIMSPCLLKLKNGELGMLYAQKDKTASGFVVCTPRYRYSKDDGKTWSEAIQCFTNATYNVINNHRLIQLKSGRLLVPMAYHGSEEEKVFKAGSVRFIYSDDNGRTWAFFNVEISSPYSDTYGLQEPGVIELEDGRLWMYCRTAYGHQWQSYSSDGGKTWTKPMPNWKFTSTISPMLIAKANENLLAIYNPQPYSPINLTEKSIGWPRRSPLLCAISKDGGKSFENTNQVFAPNFVNDCVFIEDDLNESYCYPALIEVDGGFLVAYYHTNGSNYCLNCCKISKVFWEEIEE